METQISKLEALIEGLTGYFTMSSRPWIETLTSYAKCFTTDFMSEIYLLGSRTSTLCLCQTSSQKT
jgi:hypothetical protein